METRRVYKQLLRTVQQVFRDDHYRQSEIFRIVREKFKTENDLRKAKEIEKVLRENICQGVLKGDGQYQLQINKQHLRDNKR